MKKKILKALEGSIAKWRAIVAGEGADEGTTNCPLCQMFNNDQSDCDQCMGCPVYEKTKKQWCLGTPYKEWWDNREMLFPISANSARSRKRAKAMLQFLISLRPRQLKSARKSA